MSVDAAGKSAFGVVQVHAAQVLETHDLAKLIQSGLCRVAGAEIVPSSEGVAGIDAYAYP